MAKERSPAQECRLLCSTGEVTAAVGDRFTDKDVEWEIVAFGTTLSYSPSTIGGTPSVFCKTNTMPSWFKQYIEDDGTLEWCGDSVAAMMLTAADSKRRSARGDLLKRAAEEGTHPDPWAGFAEIDRD